jgi:iron-sulfur cluster repair protein YtfE (RIC family)
LADLFAVLAADHERIFALSNRLTGASALPPDEPGRRKAVADELVMELSRHEIVEEMLLWPAVRERVDDGAEICATALDQEHYGKRALNELVHVRAGNEEFDDLANTIASHLRKHITYEENIVWPKLRRKLTGDEANRLGAEARQAERLAPTRPHPHLPPDTRLLRTMAPAAALLDRVRNLFVRRL